MLLTGGHSRQAWRPAIRLRTVAPARGDLFADQAVELPLVVEQGWLVGQVCTCGKHRQVGAVVARRLLLVQVRGVLCEGWVRGMDQITARKITEAWIKARYASPD